MKEFDIVIYTCERPVNYLGTTVEMLVQQKIKPIVQHGSGTQRKNTVPVTLNHGEVKINTLEESYEVTFRDEPIWYRANRNLADAFNQGDMQKDILILEDDVKPCRNVGKQIQAVYNVLKVVKGCEKYIIALYNTSNWGVGPQDLIDYPVSNFFGLQACLYSANIRELCSGFHYKCGGKMPADFVTKKIVEQNRDIRLLAVRFSLFQHIGLTTTGLGDFHRAENFLDGNK